MRLLFCCLLCACMVEAGVERDAPMAANETIDDREPGIAADDDSFAGCELLDTSTVSGCFGWSGCSWQSTTLWSCSCGTIREVCSGGSSLNGTSNTRCECTLDGQSLPACEC